MCRPLLLCILVISIAASNALAIFIDDFQAGEYTLGREGSATPCTASGTQYDATWTTTYGAGGDLNVDLTMGGATAILVDLISGDMYSGPRLSII